MIHAAGADSIASLRYSGSTRAWLTILFDSIEKVTEDPREDAASETVREVGPHTGAEQAGFRLVRVDAPREPLPDCESHPVQPVAHVIGFPGDRAAGVHAGDDTSTWSGNAGDLFADPEPGSYPDLRAIANLCDLTWVIESFDALVLRVGR